MLQVLRKLMVDFVSPITRHHSVNLMAAVAVVWNDRRESGVAKHLSVSRTITRTQNLSKI